MSFSLAGITSSIKALNPLGESMYYDEITGNEHRAEIVLLDSGDSLYVQFNPSKLSIARGTANWGSPKTGATNLPTKQYTGHSADTLSVDLLLDASEADEEGGGSVMGLIEAFHKLTLPYEHTPADGGIRPPLLHFKWGTDGVSFAGVLKDVSYDITMFNEKGLPMRATIKMSMSGEFMPKKTDVASILAAQFKADAPSSAGDAADAFPKDLNDSKAM